MLITKKHMCRIFINITLSHLRSKENTSVYALALEYVKIYQCDIFDIAH